MKRVFLFLVTNFAILIVLSIAWMVLSHFFGIGTTLDENYNLQLGPLLAFAAVFGFGGAFISLAISKWSAKRMTGCQVLTDPRSDAELWLVQTVKRHADAAGIGMPEVAVYEGPPNAFATGARKDKALVAVSTGLMQGMTRDEVDAVLGHEISHVANGDMVTLTLISGVVNTFVIFFSRVIGHTIDRVVFRNERGPGIGYFVGVIVSQILLSILATMIVMSFSRRREFRADAGSARLAGREKMIAALERLKGGANEPLPEQMAAFGIAGGGAHGLKRLFLSHPPLDERIEALKKMTVQA